VQPSLFVGVLYWSWSRGVVGVQVPLYGVISSGIMGVTLLINVVPDIIPLYRFSVNFLGWWCCSRDKRDPGALEREDQTISLAMETSRSAIGEIPVGGNQVTSVCGDSELLLKPSRT